MLWSLKRRNDDHKTAVDARAGAWAGSRQLAQHRLEASARGTPRADARERS
ncbi:hypothetical protein ACFPRL_21660 [Pseudoclavibacter helvolus]